MIKYFILGLCLISSTNAIGQDTLYANKGNIWDEFSRVAFSEMQTIKDEHIKKAYYYQYEKYNDLSSYTVV